MSLRELLRSTRLTQEHFLLLSDKLSCIQVHILLDDAENTCPPREYRECGSEMKYD